MKEQFKELVRGSLKQFIDLFIEVPCNKTSSDDEMVINRFVKQKLLQKRILTLQQEIDYQKKVSVALMKKVDLQDMAIVSLKHKIRALKWDNE